MNEELQHSDAEELQAHLAEVQDLLARNRLVEDLVHRQELTRNETRQDGRQHEHPDLVENLVHQQHLVQLKTRLDKMHPSDIAYILEALPLEERLLVWEMVRADRDGDILLEVSDAVRESLIESMAPAELKAAAESLDTDELADLAPDLP